MDCVTGNKSSPPENGANKPAEQNIDKNSSDEYEIIDNDNSPKLDSRMTDALDDSANLEQAIRKITENGTKMDKLSYQISSTSSPFSFEKNISEMHKYLEKLDQSSILSTPDTGICPNEVSIRDKTPNVPSQTALLEIERLRQEFKQQIDALGQELMSKIEAKMSDGMNELRAVSGTINWSGDESLSKIGSFMEESANRQLAECRDIIENTPVLRGGLAGKTKRGLRENTEKLRDLSDNVTNLSEDLSTLEASVEHCNVFAETCDKPKASNESSKNPDLTLKRQKTEKHSESRQIESLQMNRSSVEELHVGKDKRSDRNRAKDELKPAFDQRTKSALLGLFVALLIVLALFGLVGFSTGLGLKLASTEREIEFLRNSLDAEIEQRRKIESELQLAYENSKNLSHDKASTQREIEDLRNSLKLAQDNLEELRHDKASTQKNIKDLGNSLDVEIKERRKAEGELQSAQQKLEELRRDKDKAENSLKGVSWLLPMLMIIFLLVLTFLISTQSSKEAKDSLARSDVVIVKSKMSTKMQNHAIELMLASMKECTASDISKFISRKMKEKYGSEWICSISDRMPSPIVLDNQHFLSVYLNKDVKLKSDDKYRGLKLCVCLLRDGFKMDDIYIELKSLPQSDTQSGHN